MSSQVPPLPANENPVAPPAATKPSVLRSIFLGPHGVRAGWKVLLFLALSVGTSFLFRPLFRMLPHVDPRGAMPPGPSLGSEFLDLLTVLIPTGVMAKVIDRKKWGYFGMPLGNAFRSNFWNGAGIGLGALTLQLILMRMGGWFDFGSLQLHGFEIVKYGALWALMFLCVGATEEGMLRGYVQRVTTDGFSALPGGWGFWLSALIYSVLFGAGHLANPNENKFGIFMVFIDGMVMCFTLWITGDLWFAIGNHAAWDWGQSFLFGTPDSGFVSVGRLMAPHFHGPALLAGGTDGPEGSVLVLLSEAIFVTAAALLYRKRHYPLLNK